VSDPPEGSEDRVFGVHAVASLLTEDASRVRALWVQSGLRSDRIGALIDQAKRAGIRVESHPRAQLSARAEGAHQGVLAFCHAMALADEHELERRWPEFAQPLLLVLDGVLDPRNLGACLRSAEAAGVDAVLLPKRRSAPVSAVARKVASGAAEQLFIVEVSNLARRLEWLKKQGVWLVGALGDASVGYASVDLTVPTALLLGGEEQGLRKLTREACDYLVSIPMHGKVSSLNVSVATGILLFEALRQREGR
jgi:23S rRNA (guanosine2251-2'-O)-methyltransferase